MRDAVQSPVPAPAVVKPCEKMRFRWSMFAQMLREPYRLNASLLVPTVALMCLVPSYILVGCLVTPSRAVHVPELALDRIIPLSPAWSAVYGSHLILVLLPFLMVRRSELFGRTLQAYLLVWSVSLLCFLLYPTVASRPAKVVGEGFFAWLLGIIYRVDPPYNCFPSLHVAHTLVSAFACWQVHRGVGIGLGVWAWLIGLSALFTKQHYAVDVVAGFLVGIISYFIFLRRPPREAVPEFDRCIAPYVALIFVGAYGVSLAGFWVAYRLQLRP